MAGTDMQAKKEPRLFLNMGRCKKCRQVLMSLHVHDFRQCQCGASFVDGGMEYMRLGGDAENFSIKLEDDKLSFYEDAKISYEGD